MSWRNELYVGQLHTERLWIGTSNGGVGSELSGTELGYLDGVIAGTAAASKALVLNSSSAITSGISAFTVDTSFYLGIDDTAYGRLYVYGGPAGAPQGGFIRLYTAADYDADDEFFSINTTSALMWIGAENNLDMMIFYGVAAANGAYADSIRTTVTFDIGNGFNLGGAAVNATAAELNYLDLTALGTGEGSKAVVLDAGEDFTWPATGVLTYGGTAITATGAELNYLDITTLGTGEASKAVTLNANADFIAPAGTAAGWDFVTNSAIVNLKVGAWEIEGVTVTATAAELNYLDLTGAVGVAEASKAMVLDANSDFGGNLGSLITNIRYMYADSFLANAAITIGNEDYYRGSLRIYANQETDGGTIVIDTDGDNDAVIANYQITASDDDLWIGPDTDPDSLKYDGGLGSWHVTQGKLSVGVEAATAGIVVIYDSASSDGGALQIHVGDSSVSTVNYYSIKVDSQDLWIGPDGDMESLKYDAANTRWEIGSASGLNIATGGTFLIGGTQVTATAAELNYVAVTPGEGGPLSAIVTDANGDFIFYNTSAAGIDMAANSAILKLGSGDWQIDGTAVTASAAELNVLYNIQSTAAQMDEFYLNIHIADISTETYGAVVVPCDCTLKSVKSVIYGAIVTGDDVLTFTTSSGAVTNVLTIANAGSGAGDVDLVTASDNNLCDANTIVSFANTAGSDNTVPCTLTLTFTRYLLA